MPELPEVENVRQAMADQLINRQVTHIYKYEPQYLRPHNKIFIKQHDHRLLGSVIKAVYRRAKYIIVKFDNGYNFLLHLGMSGVVLLGKFQDNNNDLTVNRRSIKPDHIHLKLVAKARDHNEITMLFIDPRRFGRFEVCSEKDIQNHPLLSHLGYEPLYRHDILPACAEKILTEQLLTDMLKRSSCGIKNWLINQRHVGGIGNIYASEILFSSKINPRTRASDLSSQKIHLLFSNIQHILKQAINHGGSTRSDYATPNGQSGNFQNLHLVYEKKGKECKLCSHAIASYKDGKSKNARTTFWCPQCQE